VRGAAAGPEVESSPAAALTGRQEWTPARGTRLQAKCCQSVAATGRRAYLPQKGRSRAVGVPEAIEPNRLRPARRRGPRRLDNVDAKMRFLKPVATERRAARS